MFHGPLAYEISSNLIAALHILVAVGVSVHALLTKRDVRAAVGWIGLAWLSPFIGAVFYYALGINRVSRRASRLSRRGLQAEDTGGSTHQGPELPDNIAVIAALGERVTGRRLIGGNAVSILRNGDEAYPAMLTAIRNARHSIAIASYIFRLDSAGLSFVDALVEARSRGVEVRVLVDGVGAGYLFSPIVRRLNIEGVFVSRFLHYWMPWRMPFLNMRNHKKILVVDNTVGFTGGLNISAKNVRAKRPANPINDVHFRIEGPVVRQLMLTFAEDWKFTTGEHFADQSWSPDLAPVGKEFARGISSGPDEEIGTLEAVLATAVSAARKRLRIVTPYFLPDQHLMSTIASTALAGVEVDIVLPKRSDLPLLDWATRAHLTYFAGTGVRLHFEPEYFDHAKLMTVDGCWCLVGSANWDIRSTRLNFEFSLECYGKTLATEIDLIIDKKIEQALPISPAELTASPLPLRLRNAAARLLLPYL